MRKRYILFDRIIFWVITLMTVMPSFLSAYTAIDALATEVGTVQTSLPMDNGTASASGTINGSGTAVDWVVTVTKFDSVDERAPNLELEYSNGLGAPYNISMNVQQINRPDMGAVTVLKGSTYSSAAETLTMTFTTDITDSFSETVSIQMLAGTVNEEESGTVNILSSGYTKNTISRESDSPSGSGGSGSSRSGSSGSSRSGSSGSSRSGSSGSSRSGSSSPGNIGNGTRRHRI